MAKIYLLSNQKYSDVENLEVFHIEYIKSNPNLLNYDALIFTSKNAIYSLDSFNKKWKEIDSIVFYLHRELAGAKVKSLTFPCALYFLMITNIRK